MSKQSYKITVGEVGNEIGHTQTSEHVSDDAAIRKARRECAPYDGDGWWIVEDESGRPVARGGRRNL